MLSNTGLHYELEGPAGAPVVVMAHALGLTSAMWDRQRAALSSDFQLLRYDARGHGASLLGNRVPSLATVAGDVLQLLDELDLDQVAFCGLSYGGVVGLWLGVHEPERVRALVVASALPRFGTPDGWLSRIDIARTQGLAWIAAASAPRSFSRRFRRREPAVVADFVDVMAHNHAEGFVAGCTVMAGADLRDDLNHLMVPTLFLAGRADPLTSADEIRRTAQRVPVAEYAELAGGHMVNVEAAAQFNATVLRFLRAHASPRPPSRTLNTLAAAGTPPGVRHLRVAR
jgi:3-oxoadipate enol-lactonase